MNPLGTGVLLFSKPLSALALTASLASASLTIEQFEFLAGFLLLLFLLLAVHLAIPVSRFEYDKQAFGAVAKESRGRRSSPVAETARDHMYCQQQLSRSKSINQHQHQQQQQDNQQLPQQQPSSPPNIIRRDQPNGFIGDCDLRDLDDVAAVDVRPTETKGNSGGTTMTAATIHHQDELNDQEEPPIHIGMSGEEVVVVATQVEKASGDEVEKEMTVVGGDEVGAVAGMEAEDRDDDERKDEKDEPDDINFANDIVTEGRDDGHDETNYTNAMDTSIEVQPNQKRSVLALVSEGVIDRVQASNQRRALFLLDAKKVPYEKVDGMDPSQRKVRDGLFELAGFGGSGDGDGGDGDSPAKKRKPVSYPQFFFVGDGAVSYVGDFERLLSLNDASDIPKEILDQHPELETWERVFVNLVDPSEIASP